MISWLLSPFRWLVATIFSPVTLALLLLIMTSVYLYFSRHKNYWKDRGIEHKPYRFPSGNGGFEFLRKSFVDLSVKGYEEQKHAGKVHAHFDFFGPAVSITDPDLMKLVLVKDFDHFTDRQTKSRSIAVQGVFSKMMTALCGEEWKEVRMASTPAFTSGKIKQMVKPIETHGLRLAEQLFKETEEKGEVGIKDIVSRYTMDNIAAVAFGLESDSVRDPNAEIAVRAKRLLGRPSPLRILAFILIFATPQFLIDLFRLDTLLFDNESLGYFVRVAREAIKYRDENPSQRREDFLQLMLDARRERQGHRALTDEEIIAQCVLFYLAGFETTANTITWAARCLALNPDVQQRLQQEVDSQLAAGDGNITYDMVNNMPYLDAVVKETLRMYPQAFILARCCTKEYRFPDSQVVVPVGSNVYIPVYAIQRDAQYYPEPERFHPDRFDQESRAERHPCLWLPFGLGPRNCIGMRFALLQVKMALVCIVKDYRFSPTARTPPVPEYTVGEGAVKEKGGTWLKVEKRR